MAFIDSFWRMDTNANGIGRDSAGVNHLALNNTPSNASVAHIGNATVFNGSNEWLTLATNGTTLERVGQVDVAVGCWVYYATALPGSNSSFMSSWGADDDRKYNLNINATDEIVFQVRSGGLATFGSPITFDNWWFVAGYHSESANVVAVSATIASDASIATFVTDSNAAGIQTGTGSVFQIGARDGGQLSILNIDAAFFGSTVPTSAQWDFIFNNGAGRELGKPTTAEQLVTMGAI